MAKKSLSTYVDEEYYNDIVKLKDEYEKRKDLKDVSMAEYLRAVLRCLLKNKKFQELV